MSYKKLVRQICPNCGLFRQAVPAKLFERFLVFVYHCFDRIVIQGYLPLLTRPERIVHFFRDVHGQYPITPQVLAKRTLEYRGWVEGYARNHKIPMLKAEKGVSKEDAVRPHLQWMERRWAARSPRRCPSTLPMIQTTGRLTEFLKIVATVLEKTRHD